MNTTPNENDKKTASTILAILSGVTALFAATSAVINGINYSTQTDIDLRTADILLVGSGTLITLAGLTFLYYSLRLRKVDITDSKTMRTVINNLLIASIAVIVMTLFLLSKMYVIGVIGIAPIPVLSSIALLVVTLVYRRKLLPQAK